MPSSFNPSPKEEKVPKKRKAKKSQPRLRIENSCFKGLEIPLRKKKTVIGRSLACDVTLDEEGVAESQAEIIRTEQVCTIRDLGTRGVKVNGKAVAAVTLLRQSDLISIGSFQLKFCR